jgi:hypothetical protein
MGQRAPCAAVGRDAMILVRRFVWARVSWTDGCALLAYSSVFEQWLLPIPRCLRRGLSEALRYWIGEYICMWSTRLSANLQSHSCTTTENISDGKIDEKDEKSSRKPPVQRGNAISDKEWVLHCKLGRRPFYLITLDILGSLQPSRELSPKRELFLLVLCLTWEPKSVDNAKHM